MTYVSLEKSRAGWQPDEEKPRDKKSRPQTPADSAANKNIQPDGGSSASNPEEG